MPRDRMNYQKEFLSVTSEADKMERERKKDVHRKRERERERGMYSCSTGRLMEELFTKPIHNLMCV